MISKSLFGFAVSGSKGSFVWCKDSNRNSCATQVFGVQPDRQSSFWAWSVEGFLECFGLKTI